jgi:AraC-like DNA-binding protein
MLTVIVHPRFLTEGTGTAIAMRYVRPLCSGGGVSCLVLTGEEEWQRTVLRCCLDIDRAERAQEFGYELEIKGMLCQAVCAIVRACRPHLSGLENSRPSHATFKRLLTFLHAHYSEKLTLERLGAEVGVSRETCCRIFKRVMGMTLIEYLAYYRVMQSLPMLEDGQMGILDVADRVGFSSASRYAAAFRRQMGCLPSQYAGRCSENLRK